MGGSVTDLELEELGKHKWFHGVIPRRDVVECLTKDGDFLVRLTDKAGTGTQIVVSHRWKGEIIHMIMVKCTVYRFLGDAHRSYVYRMPDRDFLSVVELLTFYKRERRFFNGALLVNGVHRKPWFLCHKDVDLEKELGRGAFTDTFLATLNYGRKRIPVVVKSCKAVVGEDRCEEFMKEAKLMLNYLHENVVRIYAIVADRSPALVVMEHCAEGGLLPYLHKWRGNISTPEKVRLCAQAASGLEYLHVKKNCIHRDLAARNCLLGTRNVLKIGSFALTRHGTYRLERKHKPTPVRWTAPEALEYSTVNKESNVWSFGILCWEIFGEGQEPWPGLTPKDAFAAMQVGLKMEAPPGTPDPIIRAMHAAWSLEPIFRPTITQIRLVLHRINDQINTRFNSNFAWPDN